MSFRLPIFFSAIFTARPSMIAVLPMPALPSSTALFLLFLTMMVASRSISESRPIAGDSSPRPAMSVRSTVMASVREAYGLFKMPPVPATFFAFATFSAFFLLSYPSPYSFMYDLNMISLLNTALLSASLILLFLAISL